MAAHGKMRASKNSSFNDASRRWQELAAVVNVSEFALTFSHHAKCAWQPNGEILSGI